MTAITTAAPAEGLYIHINGFKSLSWGMDAVRGKYMTPAKLPGSKGEPATDAQKKLIATLLRKRNLQISHYQMPANKGQATELIEFLALPASKAPACRSDVTKTSGDRPMMTFAPTFPNISRIISTGDGLLMLAPVDGNGSPKLLISAEGMSPDPATEVTLDAAQVKFLRDQLSLWLAQNEGK